MALQYALLGLLNYSDLTGYDIKKLFDDSIQNFWYASISQIYRELNTLEKKELLASVIQPQSDRPDRRVYSITPKGREAFGKWIREFPEQFTREKRDEFSLRLFFGASLTKEELIREFEQLAGEKRKQLEDIEAFKKLTRSYAGKLKLCGGEELYWSFILRRAEAILNATIDWTSECIGELKKAGEKQ